MTASRVTLGRVVGAHGVRGELRIAWLGDGPENLLRATEVWLAREPERVSGSPPARSSTPRASASARPIKYEVLGFASAAGSDLRVHLRGIEDREAATALKGCWVYGDARRLQPLDDDEYYWHQLIGCRVETAEGRALGEVSEIWESGPHDVLVIDGPGGRCLVPTAREFLTSVDLDERCLIVAPIPGLLDDPTAAGESPDDTDDRAGDPEGDSS